MNLTRAIWHGLGQIWAHKLRSLLSLLSVFLGVGSLIVIIGFINGLFSGWQANIYESGGIEKIAIFDNYLPKKQRHLKALTKGMSLEDAEAIRKLCHNITAVSPEIDLSGTWIANGKSYSVRTQGVTPGIFVINRYTVSRGRPISRIDVSEHSAVAVLGNAVYEGLFAPGEDPIGKSISLNGTSFTVVGVLKKYSFMRGDYDALEEKNKIAFIPITVMEDRFVPSKKLTWLNLSVTDLDRMEQTVREVTNVMVHTHRSLRDFRVSTAVDELESFNSIKGGFEIAGQAIGLVTLLIGGVGITNLMLASVSERMREIGICKAIGATGSDIFIQILAEAICLSAIGGAMGIGVGALAIEVLQKFLVGSAFSPIFSLTAGVVGFTFSLIIGAAAGLYPALQASRLNPIEALRYE